MKMILTQIIKRIHERKKANNIIPDFATLIEIRVEILSMTEKELAQMVKDGELKTGLAGAKTDYFEINEKS